MTRSVSSPCSPAKAPSPLPIVKAVRKRTSLRRSHDTPNRRLAGSTAAGAEVGRGTLPVMAFSRITVRPDQMDGVPCIRGLRIPVATVVGMIADGMSTDEVLDSYPDLEPADVQEALRYAAEAVRERELPLAG